MRIAHVNEEVGASDGLVLSSPDGDTSGPDPSLSGNQGLDTRTSVQSEAEPSGSSIVTDRVLVDNESPAITTKPEVQDKDVAFILFDDSNYSFSPSLVDESREEEDNSALKIKERNGVVRKTARGEGIKQPAAKSKTASSIVTSKHKIDAMQEREGPAKKKRRTSETTPASTSDVEGPPKADKKLSKRRIEEENLSDVSAIHVPKPKKQKRSKSQTTSRTNKPQPATQTASSSKTTPTKSAESRKAHKPSEPVDPETAALDAEMCGMLIESMALSRASSLPLSFLYKAVMQARPSLKTDKTEKEWLQVFDRVLHNGEATRGSGVFGKVDSSGKVCFILPRSSTASVCFCF